MSKEVDERIVEMRFDNAQFESGVSKTLKTLDKLNESLKFEGVSKAISGVQDAVQRIDMNPLVSGIEKVANSYTTLTGKIKMEVFDRLSSMAVDTGEKIFKALTFGGAKAGLAEYETQQGAVQTILANTQHLGTTINDVTAALDNLNEYADLTIYNFTEMTRNIGTFTAAGLDLETSTSAIKGIANLAAISGSTSEQASRAMYQLSQALAAGRVNLMDWNSVVNAGMGGKVFQDALKNTAKHMGIVVDETKSFRESISGGDTWLSAEVLSETLKQLSGDMTDAELAAQGWSESEIEEIQKMAKTAMDAATVVKTFRQLMDTISEQIGSGWTKTWQLIFGDFEESKELWTGVYKAISPYIEAFSDLRNNHLKFWKENEGRTKVLQAFSNIWKVVSATADSFASSMRKTFPVFDNFGQTLVDMSDKFLKFSERFAGIKTVAEDVTESATKMVSRISDAEKEAAQAIWSEGRYGNGEERIKNLEAEGLSYKNVQEYLEALIETNFDAEKADERFMESVKETSNTVDDLGSKNLTPIQNLVKILGNAAYAFKSFAEDSAKIGGSIFSAFRKVFSISDTLDKVGTLSDKFRVLVESLRVTDSALSKIERIASGVFSVFKMIGEVLLGVGSAILDIFNKLSPSANKLGGNLLESAASLGDLITKFAETHDISEIVHDAIMKVVDVVGKIPEVFNTAKEKIANFFSTIFGAIEKNTGIDVGGFFSNLLGGLGEIATDIVNLDFKSAFDKIIDSVMGFKDSISAKLSEVEPESLFGKFISGARAVVSTIRDIFKGLFSMEDTDTAADEVEERFSFLSSIGDTLSSIGSFLSEAASFVGELFGEIFGFVGEMLGAGIEDDDTALEKVKKVIGNIAEIASMIFKIILPFEAVGAARDLTAMPKAVAGFIDNMGDAMNNVTKKLTGGTSVLDTLIRLINAVLKLAIAVAIFAALGETRVAVAAGAMTAIIAEVVGAMVVMQKFLKTDFDAALITVAMSKMATAMIKLSLAVAILSLLDPKGVAVAAGAIAVLLAELVGAMILMQKNLKADVDFKLISKAFMKLTTAVVVLSLMVAMLSRKDPAKLATAVGAITVLMFSLAGVVAVLQKTYNPALGQTAMKNMGYMAGLAVTIAASVKTLVTPMMQMGNMNVDNMMQGLLGVTNLILILTGAIYAITRIKIEDSIKDQLLTLAAVTVAIISLTGPVLAMGTIGPDKLIAGIGGMYALLGVITLITALIAAMTKISSSASQILSIAGAIAIVALAIQTLVPMMVVLSALNGKELSTSLLGLAGALLAITGVIAILSSLGGANVIMAAGALMLVAMAVSTLLPPMMAFGMFAIPILEKLVDIDFKKLGKGLLIIGVSLVTMLVAAPVLALLGVGLTVFGTGLTVAAIGLSIGAKAFSNFVDALKNLALFWPVIKVVMVDFAKTFATALTTFASSFIGGIGSILDQIKKVAPKIAETIKAVLISILDTILGSAVEIAGYFVQFFINTITLISDNLPTILGLLGQIISTILTWFADNAETWTQQLTEIIAGVITGIFTGLSERVGDLVDSVFSFLVAFVSAIADAIENHGEDLVVQLVRVVGNILGLLWKVIKGYWKWMENLGGEVIDYIVSGLEEHGGNIIDKIVSFFTEDLPKDIKKAWSTVSDIGKDVVDSLLEGIGKKWQEAKDTMTQFGEDLLGAFRYVLGIHSDSDAMEENADYTVGGYVHELDREGYKAEDAMSELGTKSGDAFSDSLTESMNDADYNFDIDAYANVDADFDMSKAQENFNAQAAGFDTSKLTEKFDFSKNIKGTDVNSFFNSNAMSGDSTVGVDWKDKFAFTDVLAQNATQSSNLTSSTDTNNQLLTQLNDSINNLVDRLENGMINIPENATFSTQINLDGKTIADASAPYLDVINADKLVSAEKGYAR